MANSEKANEIINRFIELVKSGRMPKAIAEVTFPEIKCPSNKWSLNNRLAMMLQGTMDARGFRQWDEANRSIKAGSKAIYILAPIERMITEIDEKTGEKKTRRIITGFRAVPVFRVEDTKGEPLDYEKIELPKLPLMEVAEKWNIDVKASGFSGLWLGCYSRTENRITLASPTEKTFLHELSHASQNKLGMITEKKSKAWLEITAELSAMVLAELVGLTIEQQNVGATYNYIKMFVKDKDNVEMIGKEIMKVIKDIELIVQNVINSIPKQAIEVMA